MNLRVKSLPGVRATTAEATADQLALISEIAGGPVTADMVHVRKARVAHNQYDRTLERFQKAHLDRFAETLRGKSVLPGHDTSALALGKWFDADIRTRTEDFPVLMRGGKATEIIPGFVPTRQRVTWLEAELYFANDPSTEAMRKNLDLGIWQDVSIGFSYDDVDCDVCKKSYLRSDCPHYRGQKLEDGTLVTLTYSGDPRQYEAREASLVYLGAQQHAEMMKSLRDGTVDPDALSRCVIEGQDHTDLAALKEFEAYARLYGHERKSWAFPSLSPPVGGDPSPDGDATTPAAVVATTEKDMSKLHERACALFGLRAEATEDEAVQAVEKAAADAKQAADATEQAVAAKEQLKALEPVAAIGREALSDLEKAYVDHCARLGESETDAKDIAGLLVSKGDYAGLKERVERKFAAVCAKFPLGPSGNPTAGQQPPAAPAPRTGRDIRAEALA